MPNKILLGFENSAAFSTIITTLLANPTLLRWIQNVNNVGAAVELEKVFWNFQSNFFIIVTYCIKMHHADDEIWKKKFCLQVEKN